MFDPFIVPIKVISWLVNSSELGFCASPTRAGCRADSRRLHTQRPLAIFSHVIICADFTESVRGWPGTFQKDSGLQRRDRLRSKNHSACARASPTKGTLSYVRLPLCLIRTRLHQNPATPHSTSWCPHQSRFPLNGALDRADTGLEGTRRELTSRFETKPKPSFPRSAWERPVVPLRGALDVICGKSSPACPQGSNLFS